MRWAYLPAMLPTTVADRWGLGPLNWVDPRLKGTAGWHPYALISYHYWRTERFRFDPEVYVFGDSGGYSVMSIGASIDPVMLILWQIENCTVGAILDHPPFAVRKGGRSPRWEAALAETVQNVRQALPYYLRALDEGEPFRWWGVIHGDTRQQQEEWHGRIAEVYPFTEEGEGWAIKPRPANPATITRSVWVARDLGVRRLHFFTIGGLDCARTLFQVGLKAGIEFATFDSTTPITNGINRQIFCPDPDRLRWTILDGRGSDSGRMQDMRDGHDYLLETCRCRSCSILRRATEEAPERIDDEHWKYRIIFHNVLVMGDVLDQVYHRHTGGLLAWLKPTARPPS